MPYPDPDVNNKHIHIKPYNNSRCNNIIVQPSVIEKAIMTNSDVHACAAFAHQCSILGEVPAAWVVLKPDTIIKKVSSRQSL